ncbi:MAG: (Fe-S)-binding protein [Thermodesulfobacteriota bacterium]
MIPEREMFWNIKGSWIFYAAAVAASCLLVFGIATHIYVWMKSAQKSKIPFSRQAVKKSILDIGLGRRIFQGDFSAGVMHFSIFWGFTVLAVGTTLLAVHEHLHPFLTGRSHLLFEASMEIGGIILLGGIAWALVRRYIQRIPRLERRLEDALIPLWLLGVGVSGFFLEALRLLGLKPPWESWSFAGWLLSGLFPVSAAESVYPYFWWGHALLSLSFIAVIPFTKLFHMIGGPGALYLHYLGEESKETSFSGDELPEGLPIRDAVFFDACMRCGRCVRSCPSSGAGEPFNPRDFIQAARRGVWQEHSPYGDIRFMSRAPKIKGDTAWYCTTCAACLEACPVYGAPFKTVLRKREMLIIDGKEVPDLMNQTLERIFHYENPWVSSKRERAAWAKDLNIPVLKPGNVKTDLCYFVGCTTSFDARAQGIARSFSEILTHAKVDFGILGEKEPCCGDIPRVSGESGLFQEKMEKCRNLFETYGIENLAISSPHCFHAFQNEYPQSGVHARHYVMVLKDLMEAGRLKLKQPGGVAVTYHDPCYLGRHNRILEEPRTIIRAIPGIEFREMAHHGADSLCCGAGGGRMWQGKEIRGDARMSEIRIREAEATGADILITACPLCLIMLEDAMKTVGLEKRLRIMDLNELVVRSLN